MATTQMYKITLHDRAFGDVFVYLSVEEFNKSFAKPGSNFQARLKQLKTLLPADEAKQAKDWEMIESSTDECNHQWEEQPGEPPIDICFHCGEVRQ